MNDPTNGDWNQLRCFMHEAIIKLMEANQNVELLLLKTHIDAAIERVECELGVRRTQDAD